MAEPQARVGAVVKLTEERDGLALHFSAIVPGGGVIESVVVLSLESARGLVVAMDREIAKGQRIVAPPVGFKA